MNQLKMDSVNARAELTDQLLKIETIEATGRELNGKASGTIAIRNPIVQSSLNISGQVTPTPAIMKSLADIFPVSAVVDGNASSPEIPFKISGTLEIPGFSLR